MLKGLKKKMGKQGQAVVKVGLWAGIIVWMLFLLAFALSTAKWLGVTVSDYLKPYWTPVYADLMGWLIPFWWVFTWLLIIVYVSRFANKKLRE